jgi:hypothetical protein
MDTADTRTRTVSLRYKGRSFTIEATVDGDRNGWTESVRETMPDGAVTHWAQAVEIEECPADCISNAVKAIITTIDDDENSATSHMSHR